MNRKGLWIVAASVVLAALIFGLSHAFAQRDFRTSGDRPFARYQVVNVNESEVIIMDVTNGDLYSAKAKDVKPYATRPRPAAFRTGLPSDKEKAYYSKEKDKEKAYYKYKEKDKDK
jgi:hypothetical protein